jgi:orotate phosphoribosyltransferase
LDARARLLSILKESAVLRGDFILSSGQRSDYYLDARRVTLSAAGSALVGEVFLELLASSQVDAVAGLTLGADPIVTAIAVVSGQRGQPLDGLIVRKQTKEYGAGRLLEGPWRDGLRVAVVEDTMTTGASALRAARAVSEAGGSVVGVYGLIDRHQGARHAVESAGYPFASIYDVEELLG